VVPGTLAEAAAPLAAALYTSTGTYTAVLAAVGAACIIIITAAAGRR
jgi:hypothetical protein